MVSIDCESADGDFDTTLTVTPWSCFTVDCGAKTPIVNSDTAVSQRQPITSLPFLGTLARPLFLTLLLYNPLQLDHWARSTNAAGAASRRINEHLGIAPCLTVLLAVLYTLLEVIN